MAGFSSALLVFTRNFTGAGSPYLGIGIYLALHEKDFAPPEIFCLNRARGQRRAQGPSRPFLCRPLHGLGSACHSSSCDCEPESRGVALAEPRYPNGMDDSDYKKYADTTRRGIKGEAFFESIVVDHAIPHRIARQNDLGVDFLCEWTHRDRPSGILFVVQIKTTTSDSVDCKLLGPSPKNALDEYTLTGANLIDDRTISYWKGLGLPPYLFYIVEDRGQLSCYYKRYISWMDERKTDEDTGSNNFYLVNDNSKFLGFADADNQIGGFARDLIVDYARLSYYKGHIVELTPKQLGFWPFPDKDKPEIGRVFDVFVRWHKHKIRDTCEWTMKLLSRVDGE
jgi:uncharacterized protein DUF4365